MSLNDFQQIQLLELAKASISHGLQTGKALEINPSDYPAELTQARATFVTLERHGELRGCIGMLEAVRPLVEDVVENAFAAAFRDPRFPPLAENEFAILDIHISILSPAEPVAFESESDLVSKLRPGVDGLILTEGYRRATFLPSVWKQLPSPEQFLQHLKQKADLPAHYWSDTVKVSRYTTQILGH